MPSAMACSTLATMQLDAEPLDPAVAGGEDLWEVEAGVDLEEPEGDLRRGEGLLGEPEHDDGVLAAGEHQDRRSNSAATSRKMWIDSEHNSSMSKLEFRCWMRGVRTRRAESGLAPVRNRGRGCVLLVGVRVPRIYRPAATVGA
jgi:hypothetical protein